MSDGSKAYEQALRCPTTRRASRTRLRWGPSRFLRAHGRLKTSLKALWFATTFSLRQAPSDTPIRILQYEVHSYPHEAQLRHCCDTSRSIRHHLPSVRSLGA